MTRVSRNSVQLFSLSLNLPSTEQLSRIQVFWNRSIRHLFFEALSEIYAQVGNFQRRLSQFLPRLLTQLASIPIPNLKSSFPSSSCTFNPSLLSCRRRLSGGSMVKVYPTSPPLISQPVVIASKTSDQRNEESNSTRIFDPGGIDSVSSSINGIRGIRRIPEYHPSRS